MLTFLILLGRMVCSNILYYMENNDPSFKKLINLNNNLVFLQFKIYKTNIKVKMFNNRILEKKKINIVFEIELIVSIFY